MARSTYFDLADRVYDGHLAATLTSWRAEGLSFDAIANLLRSRDVNVTGETVRTWCLALGIHQVGVAS